jgi:uncharacterized protein
MLLYQECTGYLISLRCGAHRTSPRQNYQWAANWFERAAKHGHGDAQFALATMYEHGRGVLQDFSKAARLYQASAKAGNKQAHVMLGELYARMEKVVLAHKWFNLGAADNRSGAAERRDRIATRMTPAQIEQAQRLAREYRADTMNDEKQ